MPNTRPPRLGCLDGLYPFEFDIHWDVGVFLSPIYIYIHKKSKLIVGESLEDSEDTCFFFPLLAICVRFIFPKYTVDTGILTFCLHDSHGILSVSLVFARALER